MSDTRRNTLVAGAGGFIGGHLVRRLLDEGQRVLAVDVKSLSEWHQVHDDAEVNLPHADLRERYVALGVHMRIHDVYNLAADMGGMGFIETHKLDCMLSSLINTHLLMDARDAGVERYFFASSACVYPAYAQLLPDVTALREEDAYPAEPEDGYGWEKLFAERMCRHFAEETDLEVRVARYHNVAGTHGTWTGGREKAPAAICRKVAEVALGVRDFVEIWGDGQQTRSFMDVRDCVEGTRRLMESDVREPLNVGSSELVSIDDLVTLTLRVAGVRASRRYVPAAPQGVRGRNSDNTNIRVALGWEPSISLERLIGRLYPWVYDQVKKELSS